MELKDINLKIDNSERLLNNIAELSSKIMKDEKTTFKELDNIYKKYKDSLKEIKNFSKDYKKNKNSKNDKLSIKIENIIKKEYNINTKIILEGNDFISNDVAKDINKVFCNNVAIYKNFYFVGDIIKQKDGIYVSIKTKGLNSDNMKIKSIELYRKKIKNKD